MWQSKKNKVILSHNIIVVATEILLGIYVMLQYGLLQSRCKGHFDMNMCLIFCPLLSFSHLLFSKLYQHNLVCYNMLSMKTCQWMSSLIAMHQASFYENWNFTIAKHNV